MSESRSDNSNSGLPQERCPLCGRPVIQRDRLNENEGLADRTAVAVLKCSECGDSGVARFDMIVIPEWVLEENEKER